MDFWTLRQGLIQKGYSRRMAEAKIAHDVILGAIVSAGLHDRITIKGGVVMSDITNLARRATMDIDVDLMHYPLGDASIRNLIARFDRHSECDFVLDGKITDLRQQDYRGKRIYVVISDGHGHSVRTKMDIGVHTYETIRQIEYEFHVVTNNASIRLQTNTIEQMFAEKLKSLLRIGPVSTRYKDVYDMYYLVPHVRKSELRKCMRALIFDDEKMLEKSVADVHNRLVDIFANMSFMRRLAHPNSTWLDVSAEVVASSLVSFLNGIG